MSAGAEWDAWAYHDVRKLLQECTCPACHVVWQHYDSKPWIKEHFGSVTVPIICPECGTASVAGSTKRYGPRKIYREPTAEEVLARTATPKSGWFGRRAREGKTDDWDYERG